MRFWILFTVFPLVCIANDFLRAESVGSAMDQVTHFEQHVRPLLASKCVKCHGDQKQEGGLRLDSLEAMLKGGDSGTALVPGKLSESLVVDAVKYESLEMPPSGKLSDKEIGHITNWVASGAIWPEHSGIIRDSASTISKEDRQWWAFQPLRMPEVPQVDREDWSKNEIDRFIFHRLDAQGMTPAPQATKEQLVRRVYYDLLGMPPTPTETEAFVNDESTQAWERLVESLLSDSRYGEHWGRYWLDLVRYAESDGWNKDSYRPHIFQYRDYVVRSFNDDKPYPKFVQEQLAGDEAPDRDPEAIVATGYLRLGIYEYNQRDSKGLWNDVMNEITDVTADVFIGMGMACARCHDHKFDPILQKDYFKLRAFFEPLIWRDDVVFASTRQQQEYDLKLEQWKAASVNLQKQIDELERPYLDKKWKQTVDKFPLDIQACFYKPVDQRNSWEHQMSYLIERQFVEEGEDPRTKMKKEDNAKYEELKKQLAQFDSLKPEPLAPLMTAADFPGDIAPTQIPDVTDEQPIAPGFLTVLGDSAIDTGTVPSASSTLTSGRRTALAEWIGKSDNPLTTRVIVNRIWQQHFGQGIVPTASDFGHLGLPPTHPELLDWLTIKFVEEGWSFKKLHKQILMSAAWQQSSFHPQATVQQQKDPAENLIWRFRVKRLNAEQIRDSAMAISGELEQQLGGPSVDGDKPRRSVYVKFQRNNPDTFLQLFDVANGLVSFSERNKTTTPVQSLMMFNGKWVLDRAEKIAQRLSQEAAGQDPEQVLSTAFRLTWGRAPSPDEMSQALRFVGEPMRQDSLVDFCHALLNSNEFLYLD